MLANKNATRPLILPFQRSLFDRLCATVRGCLSTSRSTLGLKLRANFLLIGPSGSGKTFLARELAREVGGLPFLSVSTSDWLLLGARGSATWLAIFEFIEQSANRQGAILFIDELDKMGIDPTSAWCSFLRSEVFSLCDYRIPFNINDSSGDPIAKERVEEVQRFLENKAIIVAGAAFQDIWEDRARLSMGFIAGVPTEELPDLNDLVRTQSRELLNRFSSDLFVLPQLTEEDYRQMVDAAVEQVELPLRNTFLELGHARISTALRHKKGVRYVEEILLAAIVHERGNLANFVPEPAPPEKTEEGPDPLDMQIF